MIRASVTASVRRPAVVEPPADGFVVDEFTGSAGTIVGHQADTGGTWEHLDGNNGSMQLDGNGAVTAGGFQSVTNTAEPEDADYEVEATFEQLASGFSDGQMFVIGRVTGPFTYYLFDHRGAQFRLQKRTGGAPIPLVADTENSPPGNAYNFTPAAGAVVTMKLVMTGSTIRGYVNGVERCRAIDGDITAKGRAGLFLANARTAVRRFVARVV